MINMLQDWKGTVTLNGVDYTSIQDAINAFKPQDGDIHIVLHNKVNTAVTTPVRTSGEEITITVKPYMTKPSSPGFDFMAKFNNDNPMPCRIMQGVKVKETKGMVYMKLHALAEPTITCTCCGKELTNPISRYYGIGPVCLGKMGIIRDIGDIENIKKELVNVTWEGWVIKSAITSEE